MLLEVDDFSVTFHSETESMTPVRGLSLEIAPGERVALVGESGCGKSLSALSLTRLPPTDRAELRGSIRFDGRELLDRPERVKAARRHGIAYVFQDPVGSLNPVMRVEDHIAECLTGMDRKSRHERVLELLADTGLPDPLRAARSFPCELSGGQQQRVMMAIALAGEPKLLVADEPTTALDVTTQRQVLALMNSLAESRGMAVLLITHNLGIVAHYMERVYVMYAGQAVESGRVGDVLANPRHPYTQGLLAAVPSLDRAQQTLQDIPGTVPPPQSWPPGCGFSPRCRYADDRCRSEMPEAESLQDGLRMCRCWKSGELNEK